MIEKLKKQFILAMLATLAFQILYGSISTASAYSAGDIVINEIAWAGTENSSSDEWIELYNNSNQIIDLSGWYIEDDVTTSYQITGGEIAPYGYFLIVDNEDAVSTSPDQIIGLSLANSGDKLILKDPTGATVDIVNGSGGAWYAGDSTPTATMERLDPSVTLDSAANWATAVSGNGAIDASGASVLGTPRSLNSTYEGVAPEVSILPEVKIADWGETVTFSVEIENAEDVFAYGFDINYNPAILTYQYADEGDFLESDEESAAFQDALENNTEGTLIVSGARLIDPADGIDGDGVLFTATFVVEGEDYDTTALTFGGESFVSNSYGDILVNFNPSELVVGTPTVHTVTTPIVAEGEGMYSLLLSWAAPLDGADSYIVKKRTPYESFIVIGETESTSFVDIDSIIPNLEYRYQIISVKNGLYSSAVEIFGSDSRGIMGDNDRSGRVDGRDMERLARHYATAYGDSEYDALIDTNYDGLIDGFDLIDIGVNFGMEI